MACVIVALVMIVGFGAVLPVVNWVLRPLEERGARAKQPIQFTIVDILCLFFLLQAVFSAVHGIATASAGLWLIDGVLAVYFGLAWWAAVVRLSRAGIRNAWHRGVFAAIAFPGTIIGTAACPLLTMALFAMLVEPGSDNRRVAIGVAVADGVLLAGLYLSGRFTHWIVRAAPPLETAPRQAESAHFEEP
jgi:hypothetical protein